MDATASQAAQASVMVSQVSFSGNRTFTADQLSALIAHDIGRPMTLKDMRDLAEKIQQHYHASGYRLVKVVVPVQDFANQQALQLVVMEGWLGNIKVIGNQRYSDERVAAALRATGVVESETFALESVERALTRLNRQSGIEVRSTLQPGEETGSTDLIVEVEEAPRIQGAIEANNYGNETTGEHRLIPSIRLANLTGRGDELNALAMTSIGQGDVSFQYIDYAVPVNALGTKARAYYSQGNVTVGREFRVLDIEGDNRSWGLGVSHDYIRSARNIYSVEGWLESQDLEQKMLGIVSSEDQIRKLRLRFGLDRTDLYGRTLGSLDLHQGLGEMLGGMDDESSLSSRSYARADNSFTKLSFDLVRLQRLSPRVVMIPRLYGQYAFDSLVSSEQWAIGGITSVAGHPSSVYSGDHGFTASLEGRYSLFSDNDRYQLFSRLDHGQVYIKQPFIDQDDSQDLTGVTFGLQARPLDSVDLRLDWALPIGDKTDKSSYLHAQLRYRF
ncbi:ShlB/FhaC/HecB family hemolysin secretion/activation protein [Stutzerimonas tarimensis]|uniref:ShlB/FhaC/HecB family hemolysin secretion/activation protein n=1 Tax=Stutzerimonas tarimensis TaxID=1507735 RepID=UPI0036D85353